MKRKSLDDTFTNPLSFNENEAWLDSGETCIAGTSTTSRADLSTVDKRKVVELNTDISSLKKLNEMRKSYAKALDYFEQRDYDKTEEEIIKTLRPILSTPGPGILSSSYIKQVASIVLDSLYHLGVIYLNSNKYKEKYAKAAAIFKYCQNFHIKYKPEFQVEGSEIDPTYFELLVLSVEKLFLFSLSISSISNSLQEEDRLPALYFFQNYKKPLQELRSEVGLELEKIKKYHSSNICSRVDAVKSLYDKCSHFFINTHGTGLVQRMMQECLHQLGCTLEGDEYAIISLGSFALGTMTPWSDLEFAILVRVPDYKEYFRDFSRLLQIKIINLGETILPIVGIEALNNVRTGNEEDEWFWDGLTQRGFCLDGKRWYACKSALGRQGGYKILKKLNEEFILTDIPDYELILTPDEMAEFQSVAPMSTSWFETDKYLVQALRFTSLIMGSQKLFDDYKEKLQHKISIEMLQSRTLELLQDDVSRYCLKLDTTQDGQLLNVKELYRLIDRVISALGNYFEIDIIRGNTGFTSWQILEQLMLRGKISEKGKLHLDEALTIASELRLHAYYHNSAQKEWISMCPIVKDCLEKSGIFYFNQPHILYHFYYIMLRLQCILQTYPGVEGITRLETDYIFDDCSFNKGKVHRRFIEYDKAKEYLEEAHIHEPKNLPILLDLLSLYIKTSGTSMARAIEKKILKLEKELLTQDSITTKLASNSLSMLSTDPLREKYTNSFPNLMNTEDSFVNELSAEGLGANSEFEIPID